MNPTCVVLVAERGSKVLATSRKTDHRDFGLPGGKVDPGETPEAALHRELREETGMRVFNLRKVYEADNAGWPIIVYTGAVKGRASTTENLLIKWCTWDEVCAGSFGHFNIKLRAFLGK